MHIHIFLLHKKLGREVTRARLHNTTNRYVNQVNPEKYSKIFHGTQCATPEKIPKQMPFFASDYCEILHISGIKIVPSTNTSVDNARIALVVRTERLNAQI